MIRQNALAGYHIALGINIVEHVQLKIIFLVLHDYLQNVNFIFRAV